MSKRERVALRLTGFIIITVLIVLSYAEVENTAKTKAAAAQTQANRVTASCNRAIIESIAGLKPDASDLVSCPVTIQATISQYVATYRARTLDAFNAINQRECLLLKKFKVDPEGTC